MTKLPNDLVALRSGSLDPYGVLFHPTNSLHPTRRRPAFRTQTQPQPNVLRPTRRTLTPHYTNSRCNPLGSIPSPITLHNDTEITAPCSSTSPESPVHRRRGCHSVACLRASRWPAFVWLCVVPQRFTSSGVPRQQAGADYSVSGTPPPHVLLCSTPPLQECDDSVA